MQQQRISPWLSLGVTLALALGAIASISLLCRWADYVSDFQLELTQLELVAAQLGSMKAASQPTPRSRALLQQELKDRIDQGEKLLQIITTKSARFHGDRSYQQINSLQAAFSDYLSAVQHRLDLESQQKLREALAIDEQWVDRSYDKLAGLLVQQRDTAEAMVTLTSYQENLVTILAILISLVGINIVLARMAKVTRRNEIALAEQRILLTSEALLYQEREMLQAKTTELNYNNHILSQTMEQLRSAQAELIESEKMVSLGHLIAGIAHEINTPLGAIQASTGNLTRALGDTLGEFPHLGQKLSPDQQQLFFQLLHQALHSKSPLTSSAQRPLKKQLRAQLAALEVPNDRQLADRLVELGICQDFAPYLPLLQGPDGAWVLQLVYNLSRIQGNNDTIQLAVGRAAKIVKALKNYARFDQSGEKQPVRIVESLETVLELYHSQMKHGIAVVRNFTAIPEFMGYPDELIQVWTNLVHNAIQAMDGQGILEVAAVLHPLDASSPGEQWAVVQIIDSGQGIPPQAQGKIFEPFFTTKPSGEGSGLGLSISQTIVEKHSGRIQVQSRPRHTVFTVSLPLDPPTRPLRSGALTPQLAMV